MSRKRKTIITKIRGWFVEMDMPDPADNWKAMLVHIGIVACIALLMGALCMTVGVM